MKIFAIIAQLSLLSRTFLRELCNMRLQYVIMNFEIPKINFAKFSFPCYAYFLFPSFQSTGVPLLNAMCLQNWPEKW